MKEFASIACSTIWGHLRNHFDIDDLAIPGDLKIVGTAVGKFPIDTDNPFLLEIPKNGSKLPITGGEGIESGTGRNIPNWRSKRIISLPVYDFRGAFNIGELKEIINRWHDALIPEEIPCIALAMKVCGWHSENKRCQSVIVLLIWHDLVGRILKLDWIEGLQEDCFTPEWTLSSTDLLPLECALAKTRRNYKNMPTWKNPSFFIYLDPANIAGALKGRKLSITERTWQYEWKYQEHTDLVRDLDLILDKIKNISSVEGIDDFLL